MAEDEASFEIQLIEANELLYNENRFRAAQLQVLTNHAKLLIRDADILVGIFRFENTPQNRDALDFSIDQYLNSRRKLEAVCHLTRDEWLDRIMAAARNTAQREYQVFASKREYSRYGELLWEVQAGVVWDLERQVRFDLVVNGVKVGRYTADFVYRRKDVPKKVVEELKGYAVRDYALRRNVFKACYPEYQFIETK